MMSAAVGALPSDVFAIALKRVQHFTAFTPDNDPHGEHDFGSFELIGLTFFWKIDYYNTDLSAGSEDPSDKEATMRVLTLMLAEDY